MKNRYANLALIAVAVASIGATSPTRRANGLGTSRPSVVTSAKVNAPSVARAVTRLRALFAIPKHRSQSERPSVALANAKNVPAYRVIDLQRSLPPGYLIYPVALSDSGRILSYVNYSSVPYILNDDGTGAYLEVPTSYDDGVYTYYLTSINNTGQTASGFYYINYPDPNSYQDSGGGLIWLLTGATNSHYITTPGAIESVANQNIAVAYNQYYTLTGASASLRTNACGRKPIAASVINDSGLIANFPNGNTPAEVMKIGGCPTVVPNLSPGQSNISAITKNGDLLIDGSAYAHGSVFWKQGRVYPIPVPSGYTSPTYIRAVGINASDMIVGEYDVAGKKPFLYANGTSVDLASLFPPNSGWDPVSVTGISDSGEIIGLGYKGNDLKGFALRPIAH